MEGAVQSLSYGWKDFEVVFADLTDTRKGTDDLPSAGEYVGIAKFKQLIGEGIRIGLDLNGNLTSIFSFGIQLFAPYFLHITHMMEDQNWFGFSRNENDRRFWANYLDLEDEQKKFIARGSGTVPYVGVPPDKDEDIKAGNRPNLAQGTLLANRINANRPSVFYNLVGFGLSDVANNAELAGKSLVSVDTIDVGNLGPTIGEISNRLDTLDKMMVRDGFNLNVLSLKRQWQEAERIAASKGQSPSPMWRQLTPIS